jgi:hypothetical protein
MSLQRITGAMAALVAFQFSTGGPAAGWDTIRALITDLCHLLEVAGDFPASRGATTVEQVQRVVHRAFRRYVKEREEAIAEQDVLADADGEAADEFDVDTSGHGGQP